LNKGSQFNTPKDMATSPRSANKTTSGKKALKKAPQPADAKKKPQVKVPKPAEVEITEAEGQVEPLTQAEQNELAELEAVVETASAEVGKKEGELTTASRTIAEALHQIHSKNLYRGKSTSFADYSRKRFNYSLAHAKRLAAAGKIWTLGKTSEHKDVVALIKNEAMARPLSGLKDAELEQVYATIDQWMRWKQTDSLSNRMIAAAIAYHRPASGPKSSKLSKQDAARQVKLALDATFESRSVGEGLYAYLDEVRSKFEERKMSNPRCEPRHWRSVKRTLARIESLKDFNLREITTDELKPLFSSLTKSSLQGHFRNLHAAFQYCVDHSWLEENPAQGLRRMKPGKASERRVVRTYRVEEVERIMTATVKVDTRLVSYLAVCFFAGVRPEAAMKMKWSDVNSNGYLYVPHTINKSGHAYSAKMQDVLVRWLLWWETQGSQRSGDILPVSASTLKRQRKLILKKAEIEHWIQDGTRKTFATAHRETFKCKLLTSAALGHKGTTVLDEHYDSRLMTSEDAARYWQILPPEPTLVREEAA